MKKIYSLIAFMAVVLTACQKQPNVSPAGYVKTGVTFTLAQSDYKLLDTSKYPSKSFNFKSIADANTYIPLILNAKEPQLSNGSTAIVTFTLAPLSIVLADSTNAKTAYTLTKDDYTLLPGNTYTDFSTAQILSWLPYKYPSPLTNQLAVLSYTYFESGATPNAGVPATDAFLYLNGAWQKIYRVSAAQYASVGRGNNNWFIASDIGSSTTIPSYINTFLKADPLVSTTVKTGDVKYVNYRYLTTYQKVMGLTYDGTNWVINATQSTTSFLKNNGTWIPDPTVYLTLSSADYTFIGTTSAGTTAARANVAQYKDFNISATTDATYWSDTDLNNAFIALLISKYKSPIKDQIFNVTYATYYKGAISNPTKTFTYNGSAFVIKPKS
ncbi:hypothetical protein [Mucilaginibacter lappiensis]|uniref:DUF5017 domain-containing protein n=1 Tax=Mucilaginibacter lappiensis TaxID=354630 RepID=A0A841J5N5_9SPHI|nr:hypothetical protein [Mucilaginibacter lappiensis]MBB6126519.1 hypothetical protein [Mucilaginibacter lappiensis]